MIKKMGIKAVCFDLDGVYFTENGKKRAIESFSRLSSKEKCEEFFFRDKKTRAFHLGKISQDEYWNHAREYLQINLTNQECINLRAKGYEVNDRVQKIVEETRKKGLLACICTNNNESRIQGLDKKFDFLKEFDVFISSHLVGAFKPDKKIFESLVLKAKVKPEEIVYSDDNEERIQGAKDIGLSTIIYKNFDQFLGELSKLGVRYKDTFQSI